MSAEMNIDLASATVMELWEVFRSNSGSDANSERLAPSDCQDNDLSVCNSVTVDEEITKLPRCSTMNYAYETASTCPLLSLSGECLTSPSTAGACLLPSSIVNDTFCGQGPCSLVQNDSCSDEHQLSLCNMKQPFLVKLEQELHHHEVLLAEGRQRSEDLCKKMFDAVAEFVKERQQMEKLYMKISDTLSRMKAMAILCSSADEIESMDIPAFEELPIEHDASTTSRQSCNATSEPEIPEAQVLANPFYETIRHLYPSDCIYKPSFSCDSSSCGTSRQNFHRPRLTKKKRPQPKKPRTSKKTIQFHDMFISFELIKGREEKHQLNLVHQPQLHQKYHRIPCHRRKSMMQRFQETSSDSSGFMSGSSDCDVISEPDGHLSVTHQAGGNYCMANKQLTQPELSVMKAGVSAYEYSSEAESPSPSTSVDVRSETYEEQDEKKEEHHEPDQSEIKL